MIKRSTFNFPAGTSVPASFMTQLRDVPAFALPAWTPTSQDLSHIAQLKTFQRFLVLGTGAASLCGRMITHTTPVADRFIYLDNIDPHTFWQTLQNLDPATTAVVLISKSGNTPETLMQALDALHFWQARGHTPRDHFLVVTESPTSAMGQLAAHFDLPMIQHNPAIGGRYAPFAALGLVPALLADVDTAALVTGARTALEDPTATTEAASLYTLLGQGITQTVMMPYIDRLHYFSQWYRQLVAESLGKQGLGLSPHQALGIVDQHSQLQLYLDGPADKSYTLIGLTQHTAGPSRQIPGFAHPAITPLLHRDMGALMMAEYRATADTLVRHGRPVRVMTLDALDAATLGQLIMHAMIETAALAHLMGIDPYDQPAVEEGKILAQRYLSGKDHDITPTHSTP